MTRRTKPGVLPGTAIGLAAGAVGTAAMTAYQDAVSRARGGSEESGKEPSTWEEAPTPARVAKLVSERLLSRRYPTKTLGVDLSYHLVYGLSVAGAYRALQGLRS